MKSPTKSRLLSITLILVALIIFVLSFIRESSYQVQLHLGVVSPTPTPPFNLNSGVPTHGDYVLPYPGILPTNPLYPLKMIRDRIGLLLTTNANRRALLLLHYADKRIAAARELAQNGSMKEAISTAIKAEIYLGQAINSGPQVDSSLQASLFDELKRATLKHEEVIERLIKSTEGETRNQAAELHQQLDQYRNHIVSLSGQPFGYSRPEDIVSPPASPSASPNPPPTEPYL